MQNKTHRQQSDGFYFYTLAKNKSILAGSTYLHAGDSVITRTTAQ